MVHGLSHEGNADGAMSDEADMNEPRQDAEGWARYLTVGDDTGTSVRHGPPSPRSSPPSGTPTPPSPRCVPKQIP
jgi:hypothetical protein